MSDDDFEAWVALWHAMRDIVLVGHEPGGPCPFTVGHSFREHFLYSELYGPPTWRVVDKKLQAVINAGRHRSPEAGL